MDATNISISRLAAFDIDFLRTMLGRFTKLHSGGCLFLFGSRAKQDNRYYSDYDLLFLSTHFASMSESERYRQIMKQVRIAHSEWTIEPHCYTFDEWQNKKGTLFYEEVTRYQKDVAQLIE